MRSLKSNYRSTGIGKPRTPDYSQLWLECAKRGLSAEPVIRTALQQLSINPTDAECVQLVLERIRAYDTQETLDPDSFRRTNPCVPGVVDGPIQMGAIQHSNLVWGISPAMLTQHMVIFGMTGMGKSVSLKTLVGSLCSCAGPHKPILVLPDRKNEFAGFAQSLDIPYFLPEHFPDHHCAPPDENCEQLWFNLHSEITAASIGLLALGQSIIKGELSHLSHLHRSQGRGYPSTRELAIHILQRADDSRGSVRDNLFRVGKHLMAFADYSNYSSESYSPAHWKKLLQSGWGISLAGMPVNFQFYDITLTFAKLLLHRIINNLRSPKLELLFVMDECRPIFGVSESKKTAILLDNFAQARAFGMGLVGASQTTNLAHEFLANTSIKVALGLGHGSDYTHFANAVGLDTSQQQQMHRYSKPGFAVVKDPRYPVPFTVYITEGNRTTSWMSVADIRKLSERNATSIFGRLPERDKKNQAATSSILDVKDANASNTVSARSGRSQPPDRRSFPMIGSRSSQSYENLHRILRAQANHVMPFLFRHEASSLGGVKGGASLLLAEKEALRQNLIIKHSLPRAKTNVCFWEITDHGYDLLKTTRPKWKSKGKYVHKFCVYRITETFERRGYKAEIEHRRSNGKLVDLLISKGQEVIYLEVCASRPIEKERSNLHGDLEGEPLPTEIVLAVTDRKMKKSLEKLISDHSLEPPLSRPVRVALVGDLIEFLEIEE